MADEHNPADKEADAQQGNPDGEKNRIVESQPSAIKQTVSSEQSADAKNPPRPALLVRLWHGLWRKRIFIHHHPGHQTPNWAEKTSMFITAGILFAAIAQALIYWGQEGIMQRSLGQNQQSITLNTGQLAVAGRNATTAEGTLNDQHKSFEIDQRPYIIGRNPLFAQPGIVPNARLNVNVSITNIGRTPAIDEWGYLHLLLYFTPKTTPNEQHRLLREFTGKAFKKAYEAERADRRKMAKIPETRNDVAPGADYFGTAQSDFILTKEEIKDLQSAESNATIYLIGIGTYFDSSGNPYETEFCWYYFGPNPTLWHRCPAYNQIH